MVPLALPPLLADQFEDAWRVVVPSNAPATHVLLPDHRAGFTFIGGYPFGPDTVLFAGPSREARVVPMIAEAVYAGVAIKPGAAAALGFDPLVGHTPLLLPALAAGLEQAATSGETGLLVEALYIMKAGARPIDPVVAAMLDIITRNGRTYERAAPDEALSERQRRRFVRAVGLSPSAFRATFRLRRAMIEGIVMPDTSIASLASGYGYADQPHFGRAVNDAFQAPPREVRRRLQQTRERFINSTR